MTVVDTREGHRASQLHRVDVELREVRGDGEEVEVPVPYLDPPRPTAEVVNGAAELRFGITENKQDTCVFRLVFQYVHRDSGVVVRALTRWKVEPRRLLHNQTA